MVGVIRGEMGVNVERDLASHATPRRRGGLPPFYVALWVVFSSMALSYLAMLSVRPDLAVGLGQHLAALAGTETKTAEAKDADDERALAEIAELRQGLERMQRDVGAMRSLITAREERDRAFAARIAAVEAQKVTEQTSPLATASVTRAPTEAPASSGPASSAEEAAPNRLTVEGPLAETPQRQSRPRDTGRVAFGPVQVKPAPANEPAGPRGIQIATGPSVDALRISWMLLAERHKEVLKRLEPRFLPSTAGSGPAYRLIAGPIESTAAANKVCTELRARRVTCGVSAFGGEPL